MMAETLTFPSVTTTSPCHRFTFSQSHFSDYSERCCSSSSTTPFVSAPSSPGKHGYAGFYFSAPTSPRRAAAQAGPFQSGSHMLPSSWDEKTWHREATPSFIGSEFEFTGLFVDRNYHSMSPAPMSTANDLFCNGQIKPLKQQQACVGQKQQQQQQDMVTNEKTINSASSHLQGANISANNTCNQSSMISENQNHGDTSSLHDEIHNVNNQGVMNEMPCPLQVCVQQEVFILANNIKPLNDQVLRTSYQNVFSNVNENASNCQGDINNRANSFAVNDISFAPDVESSRGAPSFIMGISQISLSEPVSPSRLSAALDNQVYGAFNNSLSCPQSPSMLKDAMATLSSRVENTFNEIDLDYMAKCEGQDTRRSRYTTGRHRRTRSFSPLRILHLDDSRSDDEEGEEMGMLRDCSLQKEKDEDVVISAHRRSKRWTLKDLLYRKSGGENRRGSSKKLSPEESKPTRTTSTKPTRTTRTTSTKICDEKQSKVTSKGRSKGRATKAYVDANGHSKRSATNQYVQPTKKCPSEEHKIKTFGPKGKCFDQKMNPPFRAISPHELHYIMHKAQAEELKKKTFLPYREGLLSCLGFSAKGYKIISTISKTLRSVSRP